jgi:RNA polymerase sigma-70 factor, ECF subfamily
MNSTDQFEQIVQEHYESLFRFAFSLAKNESDASDLTQHTFYVWARKGDQLRDATKAKTWLFTTLYRAFLMGRRTEKRFANDEFESVSEGLSVDAVIDADSAPALAALARVDKIFQAPVALFYLEDIPYAEIAQILQIPIGTVKSRISRGIVQLREILLTAPSSLSGS